MKLDSSDLALQPEKIIKSGRFKIDIFTPSSKICYTSAGIDLVRLSSGTEDLLILDYTPGRPAQITHHVVS